MKKTKSILMLVAGCLMVFASVPLFAQSAPSGSPSKCNQDLKNDVVKLMCNRTLQFVSDQVKTPQIASYAKQSEAFVAGNSSNLPAIESISKAYSGGESGDFAGMAAASDTSVKQNYAFAWRCSAAATTCQNICRSAIKGASPSESVVRFEKIEIACKTTASRFVPQSLKQMQAAKLTEQNAIQAEKEVNAGNKSWFGRNEGWLIPAGVGVAAGAGGFLLGRATAPKDQSSTPTCSTTNGTTTCTASNGQTCTTTTGTTCTPGSTATNGTTCSTSGSTVTCTASNGATCTTTPGNTCTPPSTVTTNVPAPTSTTPAGTTAFVPVTNSSGITYPSATTSTTAPLPTATAGTVTVAQASTIKPPASTNSASSSKSSSAQNVNLGSTQSLVRAARATMPTIGDNALNKLSFVKALQETSLSNPSEIHQVRLALQPYNGQVNTMLPLHNVSSASDGAYMAALEQAVQTNQVSADQVSQAIVNGAPVFSAPLAQAYRTETGVAAIAVDPNRTLASDGSSQH